MRQKYGTATNSFLVACSGSFASVSFSREADFHAVDSSSVLDQLHAIKGGIKHDACSINAFELIFEPSCSFPSTLHGICRKMSFNDRAV